MQAPTGNELAEVIQAAQRAMDRQDESMHGNQQGDQGQEDQQHDDDHDDGAHPEQDLLDFYQQHAVPESDAAAAAFHDGVAPVEGESEMSALLPTNFDGAYQTQRQQAAEHDGQPLQDDGDDGLPHHEEDVAHEEDGGMALEAMRLAAQQQRDLEYAYGAEAHPGGNEEQDNEEQQPSALPSTVKRVGKRKIEGGDGDDEASNRAGPSRRGQAARGGTGAAGAGTKKARLRQERAALESTIVPGTNGMTEADVRARQARSRASGRVLARGNACEFCKRRKLRCDGARPACDHCAKKPGRVCVYSQKKPVPKLRAMQERLAELEAALGLSKTDPRDRELLIKQRDEVGEMIRRHPPQQNGEGDSDRDAESVEPASTRRSAGPVGEDQADVNVAAGEAGAPGSEADVFAAAAGMMDIVVPPMAIDTSTIGTDLGAETAGNLDEADDEVQVSGAGAEEPGPAQVDAAAATDVQDTNPDLMTLANAAEVAGEPTPAPDGDSTDVGAPAPGGFPNLEDYVPLQKPLPTPIEEISPADAVALIESHLFGTGQLDPNSPAGEIKHELDGVFARKAADMLGYTRSPSVAALEADLAAFPPKLCKSLAYAALTASAFLVASVPKLAVRMRRQDLPELGRRFLVAAQREIAISSQLPGSRIDTIQAYELVATVLLGQNRPFEAWLFAGQGLRLAVACGLHRLDVKSLPSRPAAPLDVSGADPQLPIDPELQSLNPYDQPTLLMDGMPELASGVAVDSVPAPNLRSERESQLRRLYPKRVLVPPPATLAELGDRIHVFWSLVHIERTCSLYQGWPTSLSNAEISTPWPRPAEEYAEGAIASNDGLQDLFHPQQTTSAGREVDTGLTLVLKSTVLLEQVWGLFDLPEHGALDDESPRAMKHAELRSSLESFVANLPAAYREAPSTGRHRRAFHSPAVWLHLCIETMRLVLGAFENIYSIAPDAKPFQEDETLLDIAQQIVKLSRTINAPDFPKAASPTYGPIWSIAGRFLARVCQHHWDTGRTEQAKKMGEILKGLTDVIRNFARVYPIGTEIRVKFDLMIQKDQDFVPDVEWDRAGTM